MQVSSPWALTIRDGRVVEVSPALADELGAPDLTEVDVTDVFDAGPGPLLVRGSDLPGAPARRSRDRWYLCVTAESLKDGAGTGATDPARRWQLSDATVPTVVAHELGFTTGETLALLTAAESPAATLSGRIAEIRRAHQDATFTAALHSMATNDAVWDWDLTTDRVLWNDGIERVFGWRRDELDPTSASWTRMIHPGDHDRVLSGILGAQRDAARTNWRDEYRLLDGDGRVRWVDDRGHVVRDGSGVAVRMVGGMTDRTIEHEQTERLAFQAHLLDLASDAIVARDLAGRITYWNSTAEQLYGWTALEAVGRPVRDLLYPDPAAYERAAALVVSDGSWEGELVQQTRSGTTMPAYVRLRALHDHTGAVVGVMAVNTDLSERRLIEQMLLRAQRLEAIGTLAGGIAHDLNNLFAPILIASELLGATPLDDEQREHLVAIRSSCERGGDLVRQILNFSRGDATPTGTVDLVGVATDVARLATETFPRNIAIELRHGDVPPVLGDESQLHQLLLNLAVNARDAMPEGGTLTIELSVDEGGDDPGTDAERVPTVSVLVSDTGVGMPSGTLNQVFDPFFTTKPSGQGTGLGLSICDTIVRRHHGTIGVTSSPGHGTAFTVELPAASRHATTADRTDAAHGPATPRVDPTAASPEDGSQTNGSTPRSGAVLVVDDEPLLLRTVSTVLERAGFDVVTAENGHDAIDVVDARSRDIALVLTDLEMPELDGGTTIEAIRAMRADLPLVAMTGRPDHAGRHDDAARTADEVIAKPFSGAQLVECVRRHLS